ncbi:potassium transporter inner membrane associated protein [Betaproteobacteria bacterium]|nr:potassium transporter inner membrane associated protein [Betaproteobacteria bacterium]GHU46665.1 potassium transporter inner membrane associated protein [Betaproteobacteria bacterium]
MKIIILGAGQVGASVAESLVSEENDITMIDYDAEALAALQDKLDLRTVVGNAAYPSVLKSAGAEDADLIIALTQSDQTNLVACKIAQSIFNIPTRVARLRSRDFLLDARLLAPENFAVDFAICPEQIITDYVVRLIEFPEALQVLDFAGGRVSLVAVRARAGGRLVDKPLKEMGSHLPLGMDARIVAIFRHDKAIIPGGEVRLQPGDEVFILAAAEHLRPVLSEARQYEAPVRRIMIAGGGNVGLKIAATLEDRYEVKLIEQGKSRADYIAGELKDTLVLCGNATDEDLLEQENIAEMDLFLAITNDDENNIMAASLAKRMGCNRVIALINRGAYADMMQGGPIDIGISPAHVSIGALLARVRKGDVVAVHSLRRGAAEALEMVAHGDMSSSKVVGRAIGEIPWPKGVTVAAMVRDFDYVTPIEVRDDGTVDRRMGRVEIAHPDSIIQPGDHVIVFCAQKKLVKKVEQLFQVGFHFF